MEHIITALIPIFLLIILGYGFKHLKFPNEEFWASSEKFTYFVLFPSLLIYKLSIANLKDIEGVLFVSSALIALFIVSVLLVLFNKMVTFEGASFTSIYQGGIRFNTYVFLALIDALYGDKGLVLAAFLITFMIPIINVCCITIFSFYASNSKITFLSVFKSIIKNPLILACLIGAGINYLNINLTIPVEKTLSILSSAALPLGLLSVGVGLHLSHIKEAKLALVISTVAKLIIFPLSVFLVASFAGLEGLPLYILVIFSSMPTASSSYILAKQLGGDTKLMSSIITLQTLVSIFTIAVIIQIIVK